MTKDDDADEDGAAALELSGPPDGWVVVLDDNARGPLEDGCGVTLAEDAPPDWDDVEATRDAPCPVVPLPAPLDVPTLPALPDAGPDTAPPDDDAAASDEDGVDAEEARPLLGNTWPLDPDPTFPPPLVLPPVIPGSTWQTPS
jgi:hypothetical protein